MYLFDHSGLVVSGENQSKHLERQQFTTSSGIDHLIDPRQWKRILRALLVQVGVIDTHPPQLGDVGVLTFLLLH